SPDDEKAYRAALAERAGPLRKKATEALEACREQAKKLEAFNRFTKACVNGSPVNEDDDNPKARPAGVVVPGREQMEAKLVESPKDIPTLTQLIRAAIGVRDYPLARVLADRALELDDKSAPLNNLLGVALAGSNYNQAAAAALKKATKLDSKYGAAWANLGVLYAQYGNEDRAREAFFKAGNFDSGSPDVLPGATAAKGAK
ncbi:MAG TPA: tetratricopeptide repeat protein, partial [Myxococcota bacterium]